jgi:formamidopyrimidine-DNA glycosylase
MPELPEVEVIREYLANEVAGRRIASFSAPRPLVLRVTISQMQSELLGSSISSVERLGKFLMLEIGASQLIVNFMLAGRLAHCPAGAARRSSECFALGLDDGTELRYLDQKRMGRIYLASGGDYSAVPGLRDQGPDALDPALDTEGFRGRIRRHRGQIEGVLRNQSFIAGIGTAYSDEILFSAKVFPFRRRTDLFAGEIDGLHVSMRRVLSESIDLIRAQGLPLEEQDRSFMRVHGRRGQECPVCKNAISEIRVRGEITNFCSVCQPRGRLGGLH